MLAAKFIVSGKVQGVFYRDWFIARMRALGVKGWVRNRADGSVEAMIECPENVVEAVVATARQGSPPSRVDDVAVYDDAPNEALEGFKRRPTL